MGFPGSSEGKQSVCNARDPGSIPGLGRSLGEGNCKPLQYSCLESSMERIPFLPREFPPEEPGGLQSTGSQRVRHY